MAYQKLVLCVDTPPTVREMITKSIESLSFGDVHTMLRLPIRDKEPNKELGAACTFAITHVLLSVISGVSGTLYDPSRSKDGNWDVGEKFKKLLIQYFPWDHEPEPRLRPEASAGIIYDVFRNPLTHSLGLNTNRRKRIEIKRADGLHERVIEQLESGPRLHQSSTVKRTDTEIELFVEPLYWGVRRMIEKLTTDKVRMKAAERFLNQFLSGRGEKSGDETNP